MGFRVPDRPIGTYDAYIQEQRDLADAFHPDTNYGREPSEASLTSAKPTREQSAPPALIPPGEARHRPTSRPPLPVVSRRVSDAPNGPTKEQ